MSQWGKLDRNIIPGTVTANTGFQTITFSQPQSANIRIRDTVVLGNVNYKVANITNSTVFILDSPYEGANTSAAAGFIAIQQQPKSVKHTYGHGLINTDSSNNTVSARNVYGADIYEIMSAQNKVKGISHTGWVHYKEWVNSQGSQRRRSEVLVATSKNFNNYNLDANVGIDANDDNILADVSIFFVRVPSVNGLSANIAQGRYSASYSFVANATLGTAEANAFALVYRWQKSPNAIVWTDVIDAPFTGNAQMTGNTTANLVISNVYATLGTLNSYLRVIVTDRRNVASANLISDSIQILG